MEPHVTIPEQELRQWRRPLAQGRRLVHPLHSFARQFLVAQSLNLIFKTSVQCHRTGRLLQCTDMLFDNRNLHLS